MDASQFPTRLSDLTLNDSTHNPSLYAQLRSIRKATLSIPNRLQSILDDADFAKTVSLRYGLPLVANERCGSWYIAPTDKVGSAYFKSTDGHHGQWNFSARRLNLQLLSVLGEHGGAVVVDSTRRGKNLPDAFSKTVPIWVAVINRTLFPEATSMHSLQSPPSPDDLGRSEISQIESRLSGFTKVLCELGLDLEGLRRELKSPIQVTWAINGHVYDEDGGTGLETHQAEDRLLSKPAYRQLVLCSASRRVRGAEVSEGGYIQGAGDDSEGWSHGLTAQVFWEHKELLMQTAEADLPSLIETLLQQDGKGLQSSRVPTKIILAPNVYIATGPLEDVGNFDLIINCQGHGQGSSLKVLDLSCHSGKLGSKDLRDKLPIAVVAVEDQFSKHKQSEILITCSTGKDLCVGVAVAILCRFYDDEGGTCLVETHRNILADFLH